MSDTNWFEVEVRHDGAVEESEYAMSEPTLQSLAGEAAGWFETRSRDDGSVFVSRKDDAPDWVEALVFSAHGEFLPDDWRYRAILSALEAIAEGEPGEDVSDLQHEWADGHVDVYTGARLAWLSSHLSRPGYCDDARQEFGLPDDPDSGIVEAIGLGQYMESVEVFGLVMAALEERLEEFEDAEETIETEA